MNHPTKRIELFKWLSFSLGPAPKIKNVDVLGPRRPGRTPGAGARDYPRPHVGSETLALGATFTPNATGRREIVQMYV
jgi:hypothetical protein